MSIPESERDWIGLFAGHAPITTGLDEADHAQLITFLREPVSRVMSYCQFVAEGKVPFLAADFPSADFPLDRFLESGNEELSNLQTKMLINHGRSAASEQIDQMSPEAARDMALENLFGKVSQFGLQEYFDASLLNFMMSLGWPLPFYQSINRKDPSRLLLFKQHHLDRIAELNSVDAELYKAARTHFLKTLKTRRITAKRIREFQGKLKAATAHVQQSRSEE